MEHNITSNRLRDYVEFCVPSIEPDENGEPTTVDTLVFDAWCDVEVKSGGQLDGYGTPLTESIITVLTWFNNDVNSNQIIKFDDDRYEVQHIQPSGKKKSMIVTGKIIGDQSYENL